MKSYSIAVVGATGAVGSTIFSILEERNFPVKKLFPLASSRSAGKKIHFDGTDYEIEDLATFDFSKVDIALFSAGGSISKKYAPIAAASGCVVIDNTSCFRYDDDVPLVISEVNPEDIKHYKKTNIIANPNCSTMQMLVALKPIYDAVGISRINVCTYQAISGAGMSAIKDLQQQVQQWSNGETQAEAIGAKPLAFNVLPHIDVFEDNGYTKEEMKLVWETQKILHDKNVKVNPTAVRVPVFYGHSEAVHIETDTKISLQEVETLLKQAPGVLLVQEHNDYPTAITHGEGTDLVAVGRLREDISHDFGINMWIVADNVRKGAALNAVQIAEILIRKEYLGDK